MASVQAEIDANRRRTMKVANEAYENRQRMQNAMVQIATNTAEANDQLIETNNQLTKTNIQLEEFVVKQDNYIKTLKEQLTTQKNQLVVQQAELETQSEQLDILKNIFASGEDGVQVEKEIMLLIQRQIDENHPLWDYVKDKGGDLAVTGVTVGIPVLYNAFKAFMLSKGVTLP